jgi:cystathionine beta-lyase
MPQHDLSFILNHLGEERAEGFGAVVPPIAQSSNFAFPNVAELRAAFEREHEIPVYTRGANPTVAIARKKIAALEHTEDALLFSSGSAAIAAGVMSCVKAGDHVVCVRDPYNWTKRLLSELLARFNVETTYVDGRDPANFERACRPNTTLIVTESPSSLTFELQDLAAVATIARERGITTLCDNSYSGPLFQQPADLGIDLVAHSATKYLNGHSDVVCGVLAGSHERMLRVMRQEFMTVGAIPSANDAWLLLRGIRTLELRMERSASSAELIARHLEEHPKVKRVHWPFLTSHSQHELARKQMKRCAGLMSVRLNAPDVAAVERFCDALERFLMAVSWGGHESLALPLCALAAPQSSSDHLPWDMVRLYIGLEDPQTLIADLDAALAIL